MIAVKIQDIKDFMAKLLIGNAFDSFWLSEASVTTSVTYSIEGISTKIFLTQKKTADFRKKNEITLCGEI